MIGNFQQLSNSQRKPWINPKPTRVDSSNKDIFRRNKTQKHGKKKGGYEFYLYLYWCCLGIYKSFIYIRAFLVVKFWHCNQTPVLGKCLRLSFVKIHQLHLLLGPFIALHQRLTTGGSKQSKNWPEQSMGNNSKKNKKHNPKNDPLFCGKSIAGYTVLVYSFKKPISHILCRGVIFSYGKHGTWERPFCRYKKGHFWKVLHEIALEKANKKQFPLQHLKLEDFLI